MPAPMEIARIIPDSPVRRMTRCLDVEILETGFAEIKVWLGRGFVADPFFRLYYVESGQTELLFTDYVFPVNEGNVYLLPANVPFRYVPKEFMRHKWLHLCSSTLEGIPGFQQPCEVPAKAVPGVSELMDRLLDLAGHPADTESLLSMDLIARQLLFPFIAKLFEHDACVAFERRNSFAQIVDYIDRHFAEDISIPELATLARMGRIEFSVAFKNAFGIPPKQYLTRRRVDRSKILLLRSQMSVKEIAASVGYDNEFFYYRIFRKYAKMTPDEYRRTRNICK